MENKREFVTILENCPIIAAVKNEAELEKCLRTSCDVVFLLFGDICNIDSLARRVKDAGKVAIAHIDLILGLANKEVAVDFLKAYTCVDGIISTKPQIVKYAKKLGFFTVIRVFVLDSLSLENIEKQINDSKADVVEILPGLMPKIVAAVTRRSAIPVIVGGLITEKSEVVAALSAGAACISTSCESVWFEV